MDTESTPMTSPNDASKRRRSSSSQKIPVHELGDPTALRARLLAIFHDPDYRPPVLPDVATQLTEMSQRSDVSYVQLSDVLERDPMLLAQVLKVAQSPLYATRHPVRSVADALNRLGVTSLRDIVWEVVLNMRLFEARAYEPTMKRLREHGLFTAHLARQLGREARVTSESVFLCGLLHDVGVTGTLTALAEGAAQPPPVRLLWAGLDRMHADASAWMTTLWGLDPGIAETIRRHHEPFAGHRSDPTVALIVLAEALGDELDWGIVATSEQDAGAPDRHSPERVLQAAQRLGLDSRLESMRGNARSLSTRLRSTLP
jgi:putative nucleotidyltransferase with HDIG domain